MCAQQPIKNFSSRIHVRFFFFLNDLAPVCLCAFLCAVYKHSIGKLHCKANQCSLIIHDALYFDAADFYSDVVDEYGT